MSESVMEIDEFGNKIWRNSKGQLHQTDGPAVEWHSDSKYWYINGERHRLNGPAVEWESGEKAWYVNDELLGSNDEGFWALWSKLTPDQKKDPILLSYLPGDFNV